MGRKQRKPTSRSRESQTLRGSPDRVAGRGWLDRRAAWIMPVISLVVVPLTYLNADHDEFLFDSEGTVVRSETRDLGAMASWMAARPWRPGSRLTYVTFCLNRGFNEALGRSPFDITTFLLFNAVLHGLNAWLVYALIGALLRRVDPGGAMHGWIALAAGLIFAVHPLQTTSVAYIIQRRGMQAAFFYLLSVLAYLRLRSIATAEADDPKRRLRLVAGVCLLAVLYWGSYASKSMGLTLPFALMAVELTLRVQAGAVTRRLAGALLAGGGATLVVMLVFLGSIELFDWSSLSLRMWASEQLWGPWTHFLTESRAFFHYWKLLLLPIPSWCSLDHRLAVSRTLLEHGAGIAVMFHFLVLAGGVWAVRRGRVLTGLGIFWFYIALIPYVLLPQVELLVEYKTYLPCVGVMMMLADALLLSRDRLGWRWQAVGIAALSSLLLLTTVSRNRVYQSRMNFWADVLRKYPDAVRPLTDYGLALQNAGRVEEAVIHYRKALALEPTYGKAHANLGNALLMLGRDEEGTSHLQQAIEGDGGDAEDAVGYNNLGRAQAMKGRLAEAEASFRKAIALDPKYSAGYSNLGNVLADQKKYEEAVPYYEKAIALQPEHPDAYNNLATVLLAQGDVEGALENFVRAIERQPGNRNASNNLAIVLSSHGEIDVLVAKYAERVPLDGVHALAYAMQGEAYRRQERLEEARTAYERALVIDPQQKVARARLDAGLAAPTVTAPRPAAPAGLGDPAPAFKVQTVAGGTLELARLKGKVVVLDFWATWCGPCRRELPYLKSVADAFGKRDDFVLIGVSRDMNPAAFRRFIDKQGMGWHQVFGTDADALARAYGVTSIPALFVVGRDGTLAREGLRGAMMREEIGKCLGVAVAGDE